MLPQWMILGQVPRLRDAENGPDEIAFLFCGKPVENHAAFSITVLRQTAKLQLALIGGPLPGGVSELSGRTSKGRLEIFPWINRVRLRRGNSPARGFRVRNPCRHKRGPCLIQSGHAFLLSQTQKQGNQSFPIGRTQSHVPYPAVASP
jgi:hypothetical protein